MSHLHANYNGLVEPARIEAPNTDDDVDRFCHLLDADGRAFCFANVAGRRIHNRKAFDVTFSGGIHIVETTCATCGRPRCPKCEAIHAAIPDAAA